MKWLDLLEPEIISLSNDLFDRAAAERSQGVTVCPEQDYIFRAMQLTPPESVKVVILGQDPYHTPGQADGLAFSCKQGRPQPSLVNIFAELHGDIGGPMPDKTDLTPWAKQGVLLLNTSLTVQAGHANSHANWGWQMLTYQITEKAMQLPQPIVLMLWGSNAINFMQNAPQYAPNKLIIKSTHPSPFSYQKASSQAPAFWLSRPFSKANNWLTQQGIEPIDWLKDLT